MNGHRRYCQGRSGGSALILDGEAGTAACAWRGGLLIVRTPPFETEEELVRAVEALDSASWTPTEHSLELANGRAFVFDTAYEGAATSDRIDAQGGVLDLQATPGRYDVMHASRPHPLGGAMPRQAAHTSSRAGGRHAKMPLK